MKPVRNHPPLLLWLALFAAAASLPLTIALAQSGGGYNLEWNTYDAGGHTFSSGGVYTLGGTLGQPDAGTLSGGAYTLNGGFWNGLAPCTRYAAPTAQGSGNCSNWENACTLQTALARAVSGDEIWVQMGVHYPGAAGNYTATFTLKNGVALYGGFAGTESSRDERNPQANLTILSGDIDQNDITDPNGVVTTTANIRGSNAYHVLTGSGTNSTAVLDGFVITAGQANGSSPYNSGGGMYNVSGSPTLTNVTFSGNFAVDFGGGMFNDFGSPTLTDVTFSGNSTGYSGGGMLNYNNSNPMLTDVTFSGNSATYGGGMYNEESSPNLTNVTFSGNSATYGGGMLNYFSSNSTLTNVILWGNSASNGPEIYNENSTPTISYSDIQGCGGSGSWNSACGTDGGGNIDADPLFVDAAGGNLRLQFTSPAIDAGNNAAVPPGVTTDLDGKARFVDIPTVPDTGNGTPPIVDMGAYEAQYRSRVFLPLVVRNR